MLYHCDVSEEKILDAANQIVNMGLKDLGYEYVNSMLRYPCSASAYSSIGTDQLKIAGLSSLAVIQIPTRSSLMDNISRCIEGTVHNLSLKLGIYSSAGTATCDRYPSSLEYEDFCGIGC
jgi:alpha-galactosidase